MRKSFEIGKYDSKQNSVWWKVFDQERELLKILHTKEVCVRNRKMKEALSIWTARDQGVDGERETNETEKRSEKFILKSLFDY